MNTKSLDNNKIYKMYTSGNTITDIAKLMNVSRGTIRSRLKSMGLNIRKNTSYTKINVDIDIHRLNEVGVTIYSKEIGVSPSVINRILGERRYGKINKVIDWGKISYDVKRYLEITKSYRKTSEKFGIPPHQISAKNNRSWKIKVKKSLEYTRDEIYSLLNKYRDYSTVSDLTGIKYNSLKSMNSRYFHIKMNSKSRWGKPSTDIEGFNYRSIFESKIANEMILEGIKFERQKKISDYRQWTCDFYIPGNDIYIECDGLGKNRKYVIDWTHKEKLVFYKENKMNVFFVRSLSDFRKYILPILSKGMDTICWSKEDIDVRMIKYRQGKSFCESYHYTKSMPNSTKLILGFFYKNRIVGLISFGKGANKSLISGVATGNYSGMELTRLCAVPAMKRNFESFMIGRSFSYLRDNMPVDILVTFADPSEGHVGTIYQASNWIYCGKTQKSYKYLMQDGNIVHKSKLRKGDKFETEKEKAESLGAIKLVIDGKHRYVYILNKKKRKQILKEFRYKQVPYPKK